ncbi:MAG: DUF2461 domain-containing protein, partial [Clostridia bacterium]|nr:DUF2461 domain-containing protein [Clostridia bacterium]
LIELAAELSDTIESIDPSLERRPERVVSRINRDLRFSKDKSPYRDYMWIGFHHPENKDGYPGFYVDIGNERLGYGMGFWMDNKPLLNAHRQYLLKHPGEFSKLLARCSKGMGVEDRCYKRMALPEGLDGGDKRWYPLRTITVFGNVTDTKLLFSPALADFIKAEYKRLAPLFNYFAALKPLEL